LGSGVRIFKDATDAEIAKFDCVVAREENILSLEISMDNSASMDVFQGQADLNEPVKYLGL
jgi:hypothetical protein